MKSVTDGERIVVTRHLDPHAVILSLRDAMELVAGPRIAAAREAAMRDLAATAVTEPWPGIVNVRILLARAAAARFERTIAQDRAVLRRLLIRWEVDLERPFWVPSGRLLVPLSLHNDSLVLVHDLIDARELERELIGEEIWRARHRRDTDRLLHARAPWQRA